MRQAISNTQSQSYAFGSKKNAGTGWRDSS
jgi:hypothetical protein